MKKNLTVLGIHNFHDSGAALVRNGEILAAIGEERITNQKHVSGYPLKSIEEVYKIAKIDPSETDAIAVVGTVDIRHPKPFERFPNFSDSMLDWSWSTSNQKGLDAVYLYHERIQKLEGVKKILTSLNIPINEVFFIEHHLAHASSAYYLSPWKSDEEVLVLTADGRGDGISSTASIGKNSEINRIKNSETNQENSLGEFYSSITKYLGMDWYDAFKVMGLAPYGKSENCINEIKKIINIDPDNNMCFKQNLGSMGSMQNKLTQLLRGKRFDNIAAATQLWFEKLFISWVENIVEKTDVRKIACAGGVFGNVKANKSILQLDCIDDAFFCPAASDEGLAVGAALSGYNELELQNGRKPIKVPLLSNYFGSSFTNDQIKTSLSEHNLLEKSEFIEDIDSEVGEILAKSNNIIGRFSGQMEWGPRGLGNRSIIADPSNSDLVRRINKAIKMRDFWMPFGPSILASRIDDYLVDGRIAPYMVLAFETTEKRNDLMAAIHPYDFTCRPQTVNSTYNAEYEKVIQTFESKTGNGAILNTSFNLHGDAIVWNPEAAIRTFQNSDLDVLALGNYLLKKD